MIYFNIAKDLFKVAKGTLKPHRFSLDFSSKFEHKEYFLLEKYQIEKWSTLIKTEKGPLQRELYNFFTPVIIKALHKYLNLVGVNFKTVMHIKTGFNLKKELFEITQGVYYVEVSVPKVFFSKEKKRVVWVGETKVYKYGESSPILEIEDLVLSKDIKQKCLAELETLSSKKIHTIVKEEDIIGNSMLFKKDLFFEKTDETLISEFLIKNDLGRSYAMLSGDYNILHINDSVAKMIGHKKAFVQGMATANFMINIIYKNFNPNTLDISFIRPLYFGKKCFLHKKGELLHLYDEEGMLISRALIMD